MTLRIPAGRDRAPDAAGVCLMRRVRQLQQLVLALDQQQTCCLHIMTSDGSDAYPYKTPESCAALCGHDTAIHWVMQTDHYYSWEGSCCAMLLRRTAMLELRRVALVPRCRAADRLSCCRRDPARGVKRPSQLLHLQRTQAAVSDFVLRESAPHPLLTHWQNWHSPAHVVTSMQLQPCITVNQRHTDLGLTHQCRC